MRAIGVLEKMQTGYVNPVQYFLRLGSDKIAMNELLGRQLTLRWTNHLYCILCEKKTNKIFAEGLCYYCFANAPENSECIIRPELCQAHEGKGRNVEWEQQQHNQPHLVYLALTNTVKVGVTRQSQVPTRWIDQGANQGVVFAETPYRQLAGFIEVVLKEHMTDKTNWQKMLKNEPANGISLADEKKRAMDLLPEQFRQYASANNEILEIVYPVMEYPAKVTSLSFEKMPSIEMKLTGIRGQYLMFDGGYVINIRSKSGYEVELIA